VPYQAILLYFSLKSQYNLNMEKIKDFFREKGRETILFTLVMLISSLSFALGYLYFQEFKNIPIVIEKCSE